MLCNFKLNSVSQSGSHILTNNMNDILNVIGSIIKTARCGDYSLASSGINRFMQILQAELSTGKVDPKGLQKVTYSLETLLEMQKNGDWVAIADILEFEFIPLWKSISV